MDKKKNLSQSTRVISNTLPSKLKISDQLAENRFCNPLSPCMGTIIKLPSGKTAIAHGSGIDKIKLQLHTEKQKDRKKAKSPMITNHITRVKRPPKVLTYTLQEILVLYSN